MYPAKYIRYFNLPVVPRDIMSDINWEFDLYENKSPGRNYIWSDSFNEKIDRWGKENICADMYYAFQIITGDLPLHLDKGTKIKLIYLLSAGGDLVRTEFLSDDESTILQSEIIPVNKWHMMKVDVPHRVVGVEPGKTRFSIVARVFE
jgi:hypothetical protein